jgi:chromosome partitioning protein
MASVITVMNMKGGVGKTVVAAHLAGMLSLYAINGKRRRVLAVDYDAQFNLSQMFVPSSTYFNLEKARKTSLAILQDDESDVDPFTLQVPGNRTPPSVKDIAHVLNDHLDVVPSTLQLMYVALGQTTARTEPMEERFRKFIDECKELYDVIVVDCHPAGSILTKTALKSSDQVIIPVTPSPFAVRGISLMMQFLETSGASASPHILFNMEGKTPSSSQLDIRSNGRFTKHCLAASLQQFKAFADPAEGANFDWDSSKPRSGGARANLFTVASEIVDRTGC